MGQSVPKYCGCSPPDAPVKIRAISSKLNSPSLKPSPGRGKSPGRDKIVLPPAADDALLDGFKSFLATKWKTRTEAIRQLKGLEDCIDKSEFHKLFTEEMGYDGDTDDAFDLLVVEGEGFIRKDELKKFVRNAVMEKPDDGKFLTDPGTGGTGGQCKSEQRDRRVSKKSLSKEDKSLLEKLKLQTDALEDLGGPHDSVIDTAEFSKFLTEQVGYDGPLDYVIDLFQVGSDGCISKDKLKKFMAQKLSKEELLVTTILQRRRGSDPGIVTVVDSQNQDNTRRRASIDVLGADVASGELQTFQVYFHRRPLRVQNAFTDFYPPDEKAVDQYAFAKFLVDRLQYSGDATQIFVALSKTVDAQVTWADIKALLKRPAWQSSDGMTRHVTA